MSVTLLRVREAAQRLRVHPNTVYKMCNDGSLLSVRVGHQIRIPEPAVDRLAGGHTRQCPCEFCGVLIDATLTADGWTHHPDCTPDTPVGLVPA